mmetsp:Transcript_32846/g.96865  ORF Transcript_32846/g.96865 Transcript_32846/m.96865 type:complete len:447 (-) Transcript_32846:470-1810(-)
MLHNIFLCIVASVCVYLILLSATPLDTTPPLTAEELSMTSIMASAPSQSKAEAKSGSSVDNPSSSSSAGIDPPKQHILSQSNNNNYSEQAIYMFGERLNFVIRDPSHAGLIRAHIFRETNGYALMKDAVQMAKKRKPDERPLIVDIGSNHGLFSIFAARLGADVIAIEPQKELADVIAYAAQALNDDGVKERIKVYNYAILGKREFVGMEGQEEGEGAVANVVRGDDSGNGDKAAAGMVEARPISDFIPPDETRDIACLKIDVEGFELHAVPSANKLFESRRVQNVLIEYGPPKRWNTAGNTVADGIQMLADAHDKYGFSVRLIDSEVWGEYLKILDDGLRATAKVNRVASIDSTKEREGLLRTMEECPEDRALPCEGYIWYTLKPNESFTSFMADCGLSKQYAHATKLGKRLRRTSDGIVSMGCAGAEMEGPSGNKDSTIKITVK